MAPSTHATAKIANPGVTKAFQVYNVEILVKFPFMLGHYRSEFLPLGTKGFLDARGKFRHVRWPAVCRRVQTMANGLWVLGRVQGDDNVIEDGVRLAVHRDLVIAKLDDLGAKNVAQKV